MEQSAFSDLVTQLCNTADLPSALERLKQSDEIQISQAAESLTGQFSLAEFGSKKKIYHVFNELDDLGTEQEYVEFVMNLDDEILVFIAWFFYTQFDIKHRETYAAAGRTYKQPKRS